MTWLAEGIERLIAAKPEEFWSAYDDCLWRLTTASREEIQSFIPRLWEEPLDSLPIPLSVLMCRIYLLESKTMDVFTQQALGFAQGHCSIGEWESFAKGLPDSWVSEDSF